MARYHNNFVEFDWNEVPSKEHLTHLQMTLFPTGTTHITCQSAERGVTSGKPRFEDKPLCGAFHKTPKKLPGGTLEDFQGAETPCKRCEKLYQEKKPSFFCASSMGAFLSRLRMQLYLHFGARNPLVRLSDIQVVLTVSSIVNLSRIHVRFGGQGVSVGKKFLQVADKSIYDVAVEKHPEGWFPDYDLMQIEFAKKAAKKLVDKMVA